MNNAQAEIILEGIAIRYKEAYGLTLEESLSLLLSEPGYAAEEFMIITKAADCVLKLLGLIPVSEKR